MAFSGATHDIAGDGLYMDTLDPAKQSRYIGWQGAAYNVAKVFTSGLIIYLAGVLEKALGVTRDGLLLCLFMVALCSLLACLIYDSFLPERFVSLQILH